MPRGRSTNFRSGSKPMQSPPGSGSDQEPALQHAISLEKKLTAILLSVPNDLAEMSTKRMLVILFMSGVIFFILFSYTEKMVISSIGALVVAYVFERKATQVGNEAKTQQLTGQGEAERQQVSTCKPVESLSGSVSDGEPALLYIISLWEKATSAFSSVVNDLAGMSIKRGLIILCISLVIFFLLVAFVGDAQISFIVALVLAYLFERDQNRTVPDEEGQQIIYKAEVEKQQTTGRFKFYIEAVYIVLLFGVAVGIGIVFIKFGSKETVLNSSPANTAASVVEIAIDGLVSRGSGGGNVVNSKNKYNSYKYDQTTKNISVLFNACSVSIGEEPVPCAVRFMATDKRLITEIISATAPGFGGVAVNKPGNVFDAFVCNQKNELYGSTHSGCNYVDKLAVQVLAVNGDIAIFNLNGNMQYAFAQRITINCRGKSMWLSSYINGDFPPGLKGC